MVCPLTKVYYWTACEMAEGVENRQELKIDRHGTFLCLKTLLGQLLDTCFPNHQIPP